MTADPYEGQRNVNPNAMAFLDRLTRERFGQLVTLKFEAGRVVHVRQETNLKIEELSGEQRLNDRTGTTK